MKQVIISLISERTIPNVQLIKEFENTAKEFVFITTEKMEIESRTEWIINALQLSREKTRCLIVNPHDLYKIENILETGNFNKEDEYYINLTGGTKLMALAAMNYFRNFPSAKLYYVPKGSNHYLQVYPKDKRAEIEFSYRITMYEYLSAYGLKIESREHTHKSFKDTQQLMQKVLQNKADLKRLPEIKNAKDFKLGEDKKYYSGGWFEEYVFNSIKRHLGLRDKEIAMGVKLQNRHTKNEFDGVFVKNNLVYVIECKAYFGHTKLKQKIEKDLYKLGALDDDFGLDARSIYFTTIDLREAGEREFETLKNRAKDLNVRLIHFPDLIGEKFLKDLIMM